jgi:uncharacterized protein YndB with AHSA1/START domain
LAITYRDANRVTTGGTMGTIEKTVEFDAAPDRVWAVVSNPARLGEWLSLHRSWQGVAPTEFAPGATATAVVSLLNMPTTIEWTVAELDPGRSVKLTGAALAGVQVAIGLGVEARGAGSAMSVTAEFEGQLIVGAIALAIERAGTEELD